MAMLVFSWGIAQTNKRDFSDEVTNPAFRPELLDETSVLSQPDAFIATHPEALNSENLANNTHPLFR